MTLGLCLWAELDVHLVQYFIQHFMSLMSLIPERDMVMQW